MHRSDHYEFFSQPKFISGLKALENIPVELDSLNARRPFVITSADCSGRKMSRALKSALKESGMTIGCLFDGVPEYASVRLTVHLAVLFRSNECDSIIALGGGSVMETARGINLLIQERDMRLVMDEDWEVPAHLKPLIYVYGGDCSGYETSCRFCLDINRLDSPFLYPDIVCIDERLVKTKSKADILNRGLVALTHGIEACASTHVNPMTEVYGGAAIRFITENLPELTKQPARREPSLALANATACAGIALAMSQDGLAHTLGEIISCQSAIPAGIIMGAILPRVIEYRFAFEGKDGINPELLLHLTGMDNYSSVPEKERAAKVVTAIPEFISSLKGMTLSLKEIGVSDEIIKAAGTIAARRLPDVKPGKIRAILDHAMDAAPVTKTGGTR